jgi:hypothetical protein
VDGEGLNILEKFPLLLSHYGENIWCDASDRIWHLTLNSKDGPGRDLLRYATTLHVGKEL